MKKLILAVLLTEILLSTLSGCGQSGRLYLPATPHQQASKTTS